MSARPAITRRRHHSRLANPQSVDARLLAFALGLRDEGSTIYRLHQCEQRVLKQIGWSVRRRDWTGPSVGMDISLGPHGDCVSDLAVTSDGEVIVAVEGNKLRRWFKGDGCGFECNDSLLLMGHINHVRFVLELGDGKVISGSNDQSLRVWTPGQGNHPKGHESCVQVLKGHTQNITCIAELPDNKVVTGSNDNSLLVWDLADEKSSEAIGCMTGHTESVTCVMELYNGRIISGSDDFSCRVWDLDSLSCVHVLEGHSLYVACLAALPNNLAVSGSWDCSLRIWDTESGECLHILGERNEDGKVVSGHPDPVCCVVAIGTDKIVSAADDRDARVWRVETGECLHILQGHTNFIRCLAPLGGDLLATGSWDNDIRVWDPETGTILNVLKGHEMPLMWIEEMADGALISGSDDKTIAIWYPADDERAEEAQDEEDEYPKKTRVVEPKEDLLWDDTSHGLRRVEY